MIDVAAQVRAHKPRSVSVIDAVALLSALVVEGGSLHQSGARP